MPRALILFSVIACIYFATRLVSDSGTRLTDLSGVVVSLFLLRQNTKVLMSNRRVDNTPTLHELQDATALDEALGSERAILYKHSTRCPVSAVVLNEVIRFAEAHPDWTTYLIKVIEQRQLSDTVAERLGVSHESPQVFVINQGRCVWHTSHHLITAQALSNRCPSQLRGRSSYVEPASYGERTDTVGVAWIGRDKFTHPAADSRPCRSPTSSRRRMPHSGRRSSSPPRR